MTKDGGQLGTLSLKREQSRAESCPRVLTLPSPASKPGCRAAWLAGDTDPRKAPTPQQHTSLL